MTEELYLTDSYLKEFTSAVRAVFEKEGTPVIVLDETAFYPTGGGQPHDTGTLAAHGTTYTVTDVFKTSYAQDGQDIPCIAHAVDNHGLKPGDTVTGTINWKRRHRLMRMHTASHCLCAIIHNKTGAKITGHNMSEEKSHIDFNLDTFDRDQFLAFVQHCNDIISKGLPVSYSWMKREETLQDPTLVKLANVLPPEVTELRIVTIGDIDRQADGGTHVNNTTEIGTIEVLKLDNKGKGRKRIYFTLKP